jgi:hypothetical protein
MQEKCFFILDEKGEVKLHRNMDVSREVFLKAVEPYREKMPVTNCG